MAKILNKKLALETPCTCFISENHKSMCYSDGAVGVLSDEQKATFCSAGIVEKEMPKGLENGIVLFGKTAEICSDYRKMGYGDYWDCISEHMKKK